MAGPLPLALRRRVVATREEGTSIEATARLFKVGTATVKRWCAKMKATGSLEASAMGGSRNARIPPSQGGRLRSLVGERPDATLNELCELYAERYGVVASRPTMCRALKRERLSRKKRRSSPTNAKQPELPT